MTDNAVAAFDPAALKKRIAETVQAQFGMLIPADQFDKMVADEVKAYFETETKFTIAEEDKNRNSSAWGRNDYMVTSATMTPFRRQAWETIAKLVASAVEKHLTSDKFKAVIDDHYNGNTYEREANLSEMLSKKLDQIAPKMATQMFAQVFAAAVQTAKSEVINELRKQ